MDYDLSELLKNEYKVYVTVIEKREADGRLIPLMLFWEDGEKYRIDEVLDVRRAASLKAGGVGWRYEVRIGEKITYMWLEETRWFCERRDAG